MTNAIHLDPTKRHDLVLLVDVMDGNPNGDPDAGNMPRIDPETLQGLMTDVSIKRRIRNFVDMTRGEQERFKIYVQNKGVALNDLNKRAYTALNLKPTGTKADPEVVAKAKQWMCDNFYDVRTFGGVMNTDPNCGQVRGPAQLGFARSIDPISPQEICITRVAITRPEDMRVQQAADGSSKGGKVTEMGRKTFVPYGLYRSFGFINPFFAQQSGFDKDDLEVLYHALIMGWEFDRSASRGRMACRGLYVFSHENVYGNAPAHVLQDRVIVRKKEGVVAPRSFTDYETSIDETELPKGVTLTKLVG